MANFEEPFLSR